MNVLILGNFSDGQTADYIAGAFVESNVDKIHCLDIHRMGQDFTPPQLQEAIISEVAGYDSDIDLVMVLKGLQITLNTLKELRKLLPKAIFVNWFFDKFLVDEPIWETEKYFDVISFYDFYFCSLRGVADKLREKGLLNVHYLDEGCHPRVNGEVYMNHFQQKKYASDVTFIGSIGFMKQHADRVDALSKVANEGFELRIWGPIVIDPRMIPNPLRPCIVDEMVINHEHSSVVQASLVNLGIDQDTTIDMGHSARAYRIMCAGGCYLSTATKGLDVMFKANGRNEEITADQELVLFYGHDDLVQKLDFLLEHDDIRESIAKNGQAAVLDKHTFKHRVDEMFEIIKKEME